jgi:hypothetical protein
VSYLTIISSESQRNGLHTDLYYLAFPNDRLFTKCLVYGVYSIQLVQIILSTVDAFRMFGSGYGDVSALTQVDFAWFTVPFTIALGIDSPTSLFDTEMLLSCFHCSIVLCVPHLRVI